MYWYLLLSNYSWNTLGMLYGCIQDWSQWFIFWVSLFCFIPLKKWLGSIKDKDYSKLRHCETPQTFVSWSVFKIVLKLPLWSFKGSNCIRESCLHGIDLHIPWVGVKSSGFCSWIIPFGSCLQGLMHINAFLGAMKTLAGAYVLQFSRVNST